MTRLLSLARREDGQGTTEYALLLVGIVLLAGLIATLVVPGVTGLFQQVFP